MRGLKRLLIYFLWGSYRSRSPTRDGSGTHIQTLSFFLLFFNVQQSLATTIHGSLRPPIASLKVSRRLSTPTTDYAGLWTRITSLIPHLNFLCVFRGARGGNSYKNTLKRAFKPQFLRGSSFTIVLAFLKDVIPSLNDKGLKKSKTHARRIAQSERSICKTI